MDLARRVRGSQPRAVHTGSQQVNGLGATCESQTAVKRNETREKTRGNRVKVAGKRLSPDAGLKVCTYLHSDWLIEITCTAEWEEAANSLEESAEKHSWWAEPRTFGNLEIYGGGKHSRPGSNTYSFWIQILFTLYGA